MEKPRSAFGGASSMRALVDVSHLACAATVNRRFERKKRFSVGERSLLRLPVAFPAQYAQRRGGTIAKPKYKDGGSHAGLPCLRDYHFSCDSNGRLLVASPSGSGHTAATAA